MCPELQWLEEQRAQRLRREATAERRAEARAHAHLRKDPRFSNWKAMLGRCADRSNQRYGARGIGVCSSWIGFPAGFQKFCADMGPKPSDSHSIERKDVERGYHPGNCCWADSAAQARNTSRSIKLEWEGKEWILEDLASAHGLPWTTLFMRLKPKEAGGYGWDLARALSAPTNKGNRSERRHKGEKKKKPHEILAARLAAVGISGGEISRWCESIPVNGFIVGEYLSGKVSRAWASLVPDCLALVETALARLEDSNAQSA